MIDFCLLLLLTTSQIAVCFRIAVLPGEDPLANLIYDFDFCFLGIGTAPCDIGAVDLVLVCVRLFTTKNGDRLLVCIVCLMDERSLSDFGALCPVLRGRFFSRTRGMEGRYYE
jgi:hypothetical protein